MKQKIGFLVLKSGGNEEARYLYPTVLYHLALRSRIKRELETGKVLRCCCREDETEVTVNENLELQFLRGRHAAACVEYVRQLAKYSKAAGVIPFIYGRGFSIPVAFKCKKGARKEAGIYLSLIHILRMARRYMMPVFWHHLRAALLRIIRISAMHLKKRMRPMVWIFHYLAGRRMGRKNLQPSQLRR